MNEIYKKEFHPDEKTSDLINTLNSLNIDDIKKLFNTSESVSIKTKSYYERLLLNLGAESIYIYKGLAFRNLDYANLDVESQNFLNSRLYILSALYGGVTPNSIIAPYRLDFTANIKVNNKSLKNFMKEKFDSQIKNYKIYNLASDEFSKLIDRSTNQFVDFQFFNNGKGEVPANLKKLRGALTKHIAQNKSFDIDTFKSFNFLGYEYSNESTDEVIVYKKGE